MTSRRSATERYDLAGFGRFCERLGLVLEPFQRTMLRPHFAGGRELVIVVPKKNGKTTLLAALMLYHLQTVPEAECVIAASSRQQAEILYNQAVSLIRRAEMSDVFAVRPGIREIRLQPKSGPRMKQAGVGESGARVRVLAADAGTADGVIPTLALVDELHRHRDSNLYGVFRDGLGPRNGQMITISTAGYRIDSPLGELRALAHAMPTFKRNGTRNTARSPDGSFIWQEWALKDTDDVSDLKRVKRANPASWVSAKWLKERYDSPSMTPGQWARFACGIWTEGEDPWISAPEWDRLAVDIGGVEPGEDVWIALDGGSTAGIAIVAQRGEGIACRGELLGEVPLEVVERRLVELSERYSVRQIAYDRVAFARSAELLAARGLPMTEIPYSPERMSIVSTTLIRLIHAGQLAHDGDPVLRSQVLAGSTKETERGWRLVASVRCRALIALAIAAHEATSAPAEPPMFVAL